MEESLATSQGGLLTRRQLDILGFDRWAVRHRVETGRWVEHTPAVIGTTTGELSRQQLMWLGVLHGGDRALVADLSAAELAGLRNWHRDEITVLVPKNTGHSPTSPAAPSRWPRSTCAGCAGASG